VVAHPAFARSGHPVRAERARGSASRSSARTTKEVRGTGSRRGFARRNDGANLHSIWSGPREDTPPRRRAIAWLVSPCRPRKGADEGEGGERFVTSLRSTRKRSSSRSVPVRRRIAEVGRTPSGSKKRATCNGRVESLVAIPERVNGSLTIGGRSGAQAQGPIGGKRGVNLRSSAILIT